MANKLTNDKLTELIMEILKEDVNNISVKDIRDNTVDRVSKRLKSDAPGYNSLYELVLALARHDEEVGDISKEDIKTAFKSANKEQIDLIKYLAKDTGVFKTKSSENKQAKEKFAAVLNAALKDIEYEGEDFTLKTGDSELKTQDQSQTVFPFNISNASMQNTQPTLPASLKNIFDILALESETLKGRIEKISEFSRDIVEASNDDNDAKKKLKSMGTLKFTQYALALDYLATIAKQVDSGAGAYLFETFLAALAGGKVTGKEKTESGGMGGADFTFGKGGVRGSSKYLRDTSAVTQSPRGFEKEEYVHYVIAEKILESKTGTVSSSDVDQILGFTIYYPILQVIEPRSIFQFIKLEDGKPEPYGAIETRRLDTGAKKTGRQPVKSIKIPKINNIGVLQIATVNGERYRDLLNRAVDKVGDNIKGAFENFQSAFDKISSAKESVGSYSVSGKQQDGNKAITDLIEYKTALKSVFETLSAIGYSEPSGDKAAASGYEAPDEKEVKKLSENTKKSLKDLDKLIERVILEHINK